MPENYYDKMHIETNEMRRKIMHKEFMSEAFIPIPTTQFYDEVHKRRKNNNALLSKEFEVIECPAVGILGGVSWFLKILFCSLTDNQLTLLQRGAPEHVDAHRAEYER